MPPPREFEEPVYSPEELLGAVPVDFRQPYDAREVVARIVDVLEIEEDELEVGKDRGDAVPVGLPAGLDGGMNSLLSTSVKDLSHEPALRQRLASGEGDTATGVVVEAAVLQPHEGLLD